MNTYWLYFWSWCCSVWDLGGSIGRRMFSLLYNQSLCVCVTERVPSNCTRLWHQFYIVAKLCNYSITLAQKTVFHKLPMLWKMQHTFVHMYHCCTCSECAKQIFQIGNKRPPWHLDEVVRIWWPRVRGQSHCDLTNHIFEHNSRIHIIITIRVDSNV